MEKMNMTKAFNKFFGKKPGQSMSEFSTEIKQAVETPADREAWVKLFATADIEIEAPQVS